LGLFVLNHRRFNLVSCTVCIQLKIVCGEQMTERGRRLAGRSQCFVVSRIDPVSFYIIGQPSTYRQDVV
jgi:hypothetical protein